MFVGPYIAEEKIAMAANNLAVGVLKRLNSKTHKPGRMAKTGDGFAVFQWPDRGAYWMIGEYQTKNGFYIRASESPKSAGIDIGDIKEFDIEKTTELILKEFE